MSVLYDRPVRFEDVDAANIVFFGRFSNYCHEAMESFFNTLEGGYVGLITKRRIGFPAVHMVADWKSPLRYGDVAEIETSVTKIGTTSITFRYVFTRKADRVHAATIEITTVSTNLAAMVKTALPDDCRKLLELHRARA